jgi:hypothetical protein
MRLEASHGIWDWQLIDAPPACLLGRRRFFDPPPTSMSSQGTAYSPSAGFFFAVDVRVRFFAGAFAGLASVGEADSVA